MSPKPREVITIGFFVTLVVIAALMLTAALAFAPDRATASTSSTWSAQSSGTSNLLFVVDCPSTTTCYAGGEGGAIVATTNGGTSWSSQSSGTSNYILGIDCPSTTACYAVGAGGTIRKTTNGGSTWSGLGGPGSGYVQSISCPSTDICYAVGQSGLVIKTTNAGGAWSTQASGTTKWLQGVSCPSATNCFAVGPGGTIIATSNGGSSWAVQGSPSPAAYLHGVTCSSDSDCAIVGYNPSKLLATSSAGKPAAVVGTGWRNQPSGTDSGLLGVACPAPPVCLVTGYSGALRSMSITGGQTASQPGPTSLDLYGISCPSATVCYVVGEDGVIGKGNVTVGGPEVPVITETPPNPGGPLAEFEFDGSDSATFECRIDDGEYNECVSPKSFVGLEEGLHTFYVRERDSEGKAGEPAAHSWGVNTPSYSSSSASPSSDGPAPEGGYFGTGCGFLPGCEWIAQYAQIGATVTLPGTPVRENATINIYPYGNRDTQALGEWEFYGHVKPACGPVTGYPDYVALSSANSVAAVQAVDHDDNTATLQVTGTTDAESCSDGGWQQAYRITINVSVAHEDREEVWDPYCGEGRGICYYTFRESVRLVGDTMIGTAQFQWTPHNGEPADSTDTTNFRIDQTKIGKEVVLYQGIPLTAAVKNDVEEELERMAIDPPPSPEEMLEDLILDPPPSPEEMLEDLILDPPPNPEGVLEDLLLSFLLLPELPMLDPPWNEIQEILVELSA